MRTDIGTDIKTYIKSTYSMIQTIMYALENPNTKAYIVASSSMERTLNRLIDFLRENDISYQNEKRFEFRLDNASIIKIVSTGRGIPSNVIIGEYK